MCSRKQEEVDKQNTQKDPIVPACPKYKSAFIYFVIGTKMGLK